MESRIAIRDFKGKIRGFVYTMANGDKRVTDFTGTILGFYRKSRDVTTDFTGKILAKGDVVTSLINIHD